MDGRADQGSDASTAALQQLIAGLLFVDWLGWSTRFVLFTGKGGVGKTTVAATSAVAMADAGRRVLLPRGTLH